MSAGGGRVLIGGGVAEDDGGAAGEAVPVPTDMVPPVAPRGCVAMCGVVGRCGCPLRVGRDSSSKYKSMGFGVGSAESRRFP